MTYHISLSLLKECIHDILCENGILKTYDINMTKRYVTKQLKIMPEQFRIVQAENGIYSAIVYILPYTGLCDNLLKLMQACGYFCSKSCKSPYYDQNYQQYIQFQFEPLHEERNVRDQVVRKWKYIFHIAPAYTMNSIKKTGFCPNCRSGTFVYPPRNYFFKGDTTLQEMKYWAYRFSIDKINKKRRRNTVLSQKKIIQSQSIYVLYFIDTKKIPENVDFYLDPNLSSGLFATGNIPASSIDYCQYIDLRNLIIK